MSTTAPSLTLEARREREFHGQMAKHGGTGMPPDIDFGDPEAVKAAIESGQCLRCSGFWDASHTHVWKHYEVELKAKGLHEHGQLMKEGIRLYYAEFKIPADVRLDSAKHRETLRLAQLARMGGPDGSEIKSHIAKTLSRPRPDMYGKAGHNPSGWNPPNWDIAKCLCSGMGELETAKQLGGGDNRALVGGRAESMGLTFGTSFICDFGEPFRNAALYDLRRATYFQSKEFAAIVGLGERGADKRPGEWIADPERAGKVIAWRDDVIRALLKVAASDTRALRFGSDVFRQDEVLRTLLPGLPGLNAALVGVKGSGTFGALRAEMRQHPDWTVKQVGEWIWRQAAIEHNAGGAVDRWRKTLRYLASDAAEKFLSDHLGRLRAETEDDGPLVRKMIGFPYGASQETVQNALRGNEVTGTSGDSERSQPIPSQQLHLLIRYFAPEHLKPPPSTPGPKPKAPSDTEPYRIAAAVNREIPNLETLLQRVRSLGPKGRRRKDESRASYRARVAKSLAPEIFTDAALAAILEPKTAPDPTVAARRLVSAATSKPFDTVARYHRDHPKAGSSS